MRYIIKGISNLIKWRKIIFYDRDYDFEYLILIIEFKLKSMLKYMKSEQSYVCHKKDIFWIQICIDLIYNMYHDPKGYTDKSYNYNCLEDYISEYKSIYRKVKEKRDTYSIPTQMNIILHDKAKKLLFHILEEKIEYWWD